MPDRPKEFDGFSIVAVGSFNPVIFHPIWFVRNNLIREEEGTEANLEVTHKEAAVFKTPWFSLQATQDRFILTSEDPTKSQPLRDLALGTFVVLEHTPIHAYGLHRMMHFRMESEEAWHELGHFFAPKPAWESVLVKPGMKSLSIEGTKEGIAADAIFITFQPSLRVSPGVYFHVHLHRAWDAEKIPPNEGMARFQKALRDDWGTFLSYSSDLAPKLFASFDNRTR